METMKFGVPTCISEEEILFVSEVGRASNTKEYNNISPVQKFIDAFFDSL
jgi:hypothetical protein